MGMRIKWKSVEGTDTHFSEQPYTVKINGKLYPMYKIRKVGHRVWASYRINEKEFYVPYINETNHTGKYRPESNMFRTLVAAQNTFPTSY